VPSRKGKPNVAGKMAKENILAVFTRLGGTAGMARWAQENLTEFYKIYAKLLPTKVEGAVEVVHKVVTGDADTLQARLASARKPDPQHTVQ
jgi:hypothetical protein